jgi:creatinine amidohydrolase
MRWEELTSDEFAKGVTDCGGVCLLSMGVIERHGPHMPLGTDLLNGLNVCARAAEKEPAVVFPPWFLGQIYEAKCFPGTITIPPAMLLEVTLAILDEIGRNGFTKIVVYIAHGGNIWLARFLTQCMLDEPKGYQLYVFNYGDGMSEKEKAAWRNTLETDGGGHAGESETSTTLANRPELVKMDAVGDRMGETLGRMDHVKPGLNGFWWYADHPEHWAGDARPASAEKGKVLVDLQVKCLARYLRAVKDDEVTPKLAAEFFQRERQIRGES